MRLRGFFDIIVTHLTPFDTPSRLLEIYHITHYIQSLPRDIPVVLMGDFNSLSPADAAAHGRDKVLTHLLTKEKLRVKFLTPTLDAIDYSVHKHLLASRLVDLATIGTLNQNTVPTQIHRDEGMQAAPMRLDYM